MEEEAVKITEFLEARIAEDEAYAQQAGGDKYGWVDRWRVVTGLGCATESVITAHTFRLNPARLLAEGEAKRAIIKLSVNWDGYTRNTDLLRALAAVYKAHPDYLNEWRA